MTAMTPATDPITVAMMVILLSDRPPPPPEEPPEGVDVDVGCPAAGEVFDEPLVGVEVDLGCITAPVLPGVATVIEVISTP